MLFSSLFFLQIFLPIVFLTASVLKKNMKNYFLLLASLFFYAWGEHAYVLILLISITINYFVGLCIADAGPRKRKVGLNLLFWKICC